MRESLKNNLPILSDKQKVAAWLAKLRAHDDERAVVFNQCRTDHEARAFFVAKYEAECCEAD